MLPPVSLTAPDRESLEAKTLSIEIEPSPSIILAMVQLFQAHNRQNQAVELCKVGLNYFPQDIGLRLGMAMVYLELKEKDKAWTEIMAVALELKNLSPTMEIIAEHSRRFGETRLSEWFALVSKTLAKYPNGKQEVALVPPIFQKLAPEMEISLDSNTSEEKALSPSPGPNEDKTGTEERVQVGSNVLSSLNDWLSQLKGDRV